MSPLKFSIASLVLGIFIFFSTQLGISNGWFIKPSLTETIIVLNVVVAIMVYRWLLKIQGTQFFVNGYLLSIVIKLVFFCGLLLTIRIISPKTLTQNAILVMVCYLAFTILEVAILFRKINR